MHHLLAQHDLEVVVSNLLPLIPFVSGKSCEEGTRVLVSLLGEALEAQEAASARADELKQLKPKGLMELFTPEKGKAVAVNGNAAGAGLAKSKGQKNRPQQPKQHVEVPASPKKPQAPKM